MRWDAVELARFARGAGFLGDDVGTATALALASSGGIADYDFHAGSPGVGHYVGLWAIDTDRWPEYAGADLHVPQNAARAAHELWKAHGGWSWHPAHETSHHHAQVANARVSVSQELHRQLPGESTGMAGAGHRIAAARQQMQHTRELLAQLDLTRGM